MRRDAAVETNTDRGAQRRHRHLEQARLFSLQKIDDIRQRLGTLDLDNTTSVAVVGSLARLEASSQSDIDFIILGKTNEEKLLTALSKIARDLGLSIPNPHGVFNKATELVDLIANIGTAGDTYENVSKRLLLLLEHASVANADLLKSQVSTIAHTYVFSRSEQPSFTFLLNDAIRYFRTVCVNNESSFREEKEKWALRNVKLKHSRIIMHCGLLLVLACASGKRESEAYDWFLRAIELPPLDRIRFVFEECRDRNFHIIEEAYDFFLEMISSSEVRLSLSRLPYEDRHLNITFLSLENNSRKLTSELYRFLHENSGMWSPRFLTRLIF
ncbi:MULTISPECIES: nucleotidyltransferase domain-containing protein [Rhizobium]|uniref:nucleotidyltransferase domain-containing protein n=1 Tax=Rhizobium TaxID=379 RepID=UPI00234F87F7|nr:MULTISPECIES: nucleotidyltransferase domain-containing protein [unclassified Rhizobium]MDC7745354.1 nucleotidyltransferase domain-containing protein [Rhizobium sp. BC56]